MSRSKSKIPSPARSHGVLCSPMKKKLRSTRSVCSTTSNTSVRLTEVISDSFQLSPLLKRHSVLNDDTNIEVSNRPGWWNRLGCNSKDVTAIMNEQDDEDITAKNLAEEMDVDTLSQEKENFTFDLPESSENESICSIVMPPHKLFMHNDNKPQMKFKNLEKNYKTPPDLKKSYFAQDKEIDVRPKKFFNQVQKPKTKPVFDAELLSMSFNNTITKSSPNIKGQVHNLFGKRFEIKQKNIYADFITTDSEDEIPEPQCKLFGFQMRTTHKRRSSWISERRPSTSNTTDVEMDSWKHLPSSTMVDSDFNEGGSITPLRKTRMSQLSKTSEIDIPLNHHNNSKKLKQSNLSEQAKDKSSSKIISDEVHNSSTDQDQNQSFDKSTNSNSMRDTQLSSQKSLKDLASADILKNSSVNKMLVPVNVDQRTEEIVGINSNRMQNISSNNTLIQENVNQETEEMVKTHSKQMLNVSVNKTLNQENVNQEIEEMVDINLKEMQHFSVDRTLFKENINQQTDKSRWQENKIIKENHVIEIVAGENKDAQTILQKKHLINQYNIESLKEHEIMEDIGNNRNNQNENENDSIPKEGEIIQSNQERDECDKENHTTIQNEKEQTENDTINEDHEEIRSISESQKNEIEADDEIEEQDSENDVTGQEQLSENDKMGDSGAEFYETEEHEDEQMNSDQELESHVDESSEDEEDIMECDQDDENINTEHENIPNNKSKSQSEHVAKSPEAVLHDKNNREESFAAPGRNSSNRKLKTILNTLNISPIADSERYSDGFENSSAEGSGWDSHRTLRKTFGKDFSPRKSLRNLVLQRSTKRQTNDVLANKSKRRTEVKNVQNITEQRETNSPEVSQFESYQEPEPLEVDESVEESSQDNERLRQMELENVLQRIKQKRTEEQRKVQEEVRNTLKSICGQAYNPFKMPELPKGIRRVTKSTVKKPSKPKPKRNELVTDDMLPPEFLKDMKYKPPKRFQGANAPWITKRLYGYLEKKLEPKYDYKARVRAEKLVKTLYQFAKKVRPLKVAPQHAIDELKLEMARLNIVNTHYDFYNFFHDYMPREIRIRVNPDIMNKMPVPRNVFGDIIRQEESLHQ